MPETIEIEIPDNQPEIYTPPDPLSQGLEMVKSFTGLSTNVRRRLNKALNTAGSKDAERAYWANGYGILQIAEPPYNLAELAMFHDTSTINHGAIKAKVASIVGLGYNFEETPQQIAKIQNTEDQDATDKLTRKIERIKADLYDWLDSLNPDDTFQTTIEKVATDYETFGNGYLEIGRTVTGEIGYVGHIPASTIRVRLRRDGFVQIIGNQIVYFRNFGKDTPSPLTNDENPNEIIHLKKYSPRSTFYGVPDSVAASTAIVGDALASNYNVKFFDNSATPRYIVTLSGGRLSKASEQKLFEFLQSSLRGNPHRTLFIPLPLDSNGEPVQFKMEKVDADLKDGAWDQYRERNKQDILTAHGVPLSRIGGESDQGVAASLSADRMFKEQIVVPSQEVFEKAINKFVAEKTTAVKFNLNELALIDELAMSQIHERYARNKIMKINEIRAEKGLPAIPEGDKFFEPSKQTNAEQNAQANNSRQRSQERVANNSDSTTTITGRNPQGSGSKE